MTGNDVAVASVLVFCGEDGVPTDPDGDWYALVKDAPEVGIASVADEDALLPVSETETDGAELADVPGTSVGRALVCGGAVPLEGLTLPGGMERETASDVFDDAGDLTDESAEGSKRLTEIWITELGRGIEIVGEGGMMLALTLTEAEPMGRAELPMGIDEGKIGGKSPGGVEVSEQMVVVTLTTVVDV